ncbi:MAG: fumarylacetoacetate hydrolase family protein [Saprospiraceae bacterium]|nr:fumarylacetoacetate hydrolase family protein [Saprospiraceae bacterium]
MKVYRTSNGLVVEEDGTYTSVPSYDWDTLFEVDDLSNHLRGLLPAGTLMTGQEFSVVRILKPIVNQEIWAAGVTYFRSRTARMEESVDGGNVYDRVYEAERPELFFKATPNRAVGPNEEIFIREDSTWDVPEPELTLAVNKQGKILGYTIGNDMSSRSIEGENPLYLPQAKTYERCAGIGPGIWLAEEPLADEIKIDLQIIRNEQIIFQSDIDIGQMKRKPDELVGYLFRECDFPNGCFLMTGTGIVPPNEFTLEVGDQVRITIEPIGTLTNTVAKRI